MQNRAPGRLRDAWDTRPVRTRENRMIAGVAAGIGRRYAVDPVLIRIAFAVAAFYGAGIPLYLLACVLFRDGGRAARSRAATVLEVVLLLAAVVVTAVLLFIGRGGWIVSLLLSVALLAVLHYTRRDLGVPGHATPPPAAAPHPGAEPAPEPAPEPAVPGVPADGVTVPIATPAVGGSDDPMYVPDPGTTPVPGAPSSYAGEPSSYAGEPPRVPRPRQSRVTPVTLGLAVLAATAVGVVALTVPIAVGPAAVPATALAVVGAGLVFGAFRRAGRWLVPFAVLLAVATWLTGAVPWADLRGGVGTVADTPATVAAVAPEYRRGLGDVALDLSRLDLRAAPGAAPPAVHTSARVGIGSVAVIVPPGADVVVRGDVGLGDVSVPGQTRSGSGAALTVVDNGPDGPGGGRVELDLHATLGSVAVSRG